MVCLFFRSSASLPHACYTGQQIETATSAKHHFNNLNTRNGLLQTKLYCTHHCVFNLLYALLARFICTVGELPGKAWRSAWARWALSNSVAETPSGLLHIHMQNACEDQSKTLLFFFKKKEDQSKTTFINPHPLWWLYSRVIYILVLG